MHMLIKQINLLERSNTADLAHLLSQGRLHLNRGDSNHIALKNSLSRPQCWLEVLAVD